VTSDGLSFPTSLGTSTADEIRLLGQDLTADLMGKVGFGELAFWLVAMRRPTPSDRPLHLRAWVVESADDRATVEAEIAAGGIVTATGRGTFVAVKPGHPAYDRW